MLILDVITQIDSVYLRKRHPVKRYKIFKVWDKDKLIMKWLKYQMSPVRLCKETKKNITPLLNLYIFHDPFCNTLWIHF